MESLTPAGLAHMVQEHSSGLVHRKLGRNSGDNMYVLY